jgi:hypothetical protein
VQARLKYRTALVALIFLSHALTAQSALPITMAVAKKCQALSALAYPPRVPGNPAAGRPQRNIRELPGLFRLLRG